MSFDPAIAIARFGTGIAPDRPLPTDAAEMLAELYGPDAMAEAWPADGFGAVGRAARRDRELLAEGRGLPPGEARDALAEARRKLRGATRRRRGMRLGAALARRIDAPYGLRERMAAFWADHFTVRGRSPIIQDGVHAHVESFVRPHVGGRFETLLTSAVLSPMMIDYLDADRSIGPGSPAARRGRGLNENLAREVLELHTLGAGGPYGQADVRELAELLTGLTLDRGLRAGFDPDRAEPGAETVLGRTYGDEAARRRPIVRLLRDLARHPATARHVSGRMAVWFLGTGADPAVAEEMAAVWTATRGELPLVAAAMMAHPSAWTGPGRVRPPLTWIAASMRALGVPPGAAAGAARRDVRRLVEAPLRAMGQPWNRAPGPDGWPEADAAWITPPAMAARITWAMTAPEAMAAWIPGGLPDPRILSETATAGRAGSELRFAASAAESRAEGVGLILTAPEFQRA